jgi:hypothetical protein
MAGVPRKCSADWRTILRRLAISKDGTLLTCNKNSRSDASSNVGSAEGSGGGDDFDFTMGDGVADRLTLLGLVDGKISLLGLVIGSGFLV